MRILKTYVLRNLARQQVLLLQQLQHEAAESIWEWGENQSRSFIWAEVKLFQHETLFLETVQRNMHMSVCIKRRAPFSLSCKWIAVWAKHYFSYRLLEYFSCIILHCNASFRMRHICRWVNSHIVIIVFISYRSLYLYENWHKHFCIALSVILIFFYLLSHFIKYYGALKCHSNSLLFCKNDLQVSVFNVNIKQNLLYIKNKTHY